MTEEQYLSAVQVGQRLGVTSVTVVRWIKSGYLRGRRKGPTPNSGWLVPESEVRRLEAQLAGPADAAWAGNTPPQEAGDEPHHEG